jgi:hypothetical protein
VAEYVDAGAAGVVRPCGAVTIGGDAAGTVVVVVEVVDVVVATLVDVGDSVVDVDVVAAGDFAEELHAAATATSSADATHRPSPRRTPS